MEKEYAQYLLKKTKENYNQIAESFSRTRERIWEEIEFLFNDYIIRGDRVLDLGCGNGRFFEILKNKEIEYIGVDFSENLIQLARKKYPEGKFQVADALSLPFPDNFFDKVYSIAVLHHIPSKELRIRFLKEARRVLKKDGLLILTVWKLKFKKELLLLLKYFLLKLICKSKLDWRDVFISWEKRVKRYYHLFSKRELKNLAKKSDFTILEMGILKDKSGKRRNIYLIAQK